MSTYAIDGIIDAYEATKNFLLPFDKWTWLKLAFLAFFLGTGGGFNPTSGYNYSGGFDNGAGTPPDINISLWVIAAVVLAVLAIALLFGLIGAVMEFVLIDSLRNREVRIRNYFRNRFWKGVRLFLFKIGLTILIFGPIAALFGFFFVVGGPVVGILSFLILIPVTILLALFLNIVTAFTNDFVAPIMMKTDFGVLDGWREFWPTLRQEWKQYTVYVLIRAAFGAAIWFILLFFGGIVALLLFIPFAAIGLAVMAALGGFQAMISSTAGIATIAVLGLLYILIMLPIWLLINVPVITYFKYYALMVLGDSNENFDLIPDQRSEVRADGGEEDNDEG